MPKIQKLNLPPNDDSDEALEPYLPPGTVTEGREPLKVELVEPNDKNWGALMVNILITIILFLLMFILVWEKTKIMFIAVAGPSIVLWLAYLKVEHLLGVSVPLLRGRVTTDRVDGTIRMYRRGDHWTTVLERREPREINFEKHVDVVASKKEKNEIKFPSSDGKIHLDTEIALQFYYVETAEALGNSLLFEEHAMCKSLDARLRSRMSDIGSLNTWVHLIGCKSELLIWVASLFGGPNKRTPLEIILGINVTSVSVTIDLAEESRRFVEKLTDAEMYEEIVKAVKTSIPGISPEDLKDEAQILMGNVKRNINVHVVKAKDVPAGLTSLWIGDADERAAATAR